jgi:hypothetical protein
LKTTSLADRDLLRYSLVLVWIATALVSLWELDGQSAGLLAIAGLRDRALAHGVVWSGAILDATLALGLCIKPVRQMFLLALAAMVAMTLIATLLLPSLWLNPLGPLTKNVPIAAALWVLARGAS